MITINNIYSFEQQKDVYINTDRTNISEVEICRLLKEDYLSKKQAKRVISIFGKRARPIAIANLSDGFAEFMYKFDPLNFNFQEFEEKKKKFLKMLDKNDYYK